MRMLISMMTWYQDECWYQWWLDVRMKFVGHAHDHDIIAFLLRRKLRWAYSYRRLYRSRWGKNMKDQFPTNISHQEYLFQESYTIGLTRRASSIAKVGCMTLILRMHETRSRVASGAPSRLVSSKRELPRLLLVFWGVSILPDFLVRGLAILGPRRVCRLVPSLIERGRGLISRRSGWRLECGHSGVGEAITLGEMLISFRIALSGPWPKANVFLERIDWGRAFAQSWTSTC